jgi:CRP/FNR family transcriptional regulator
MEQRMGTAAMSTAPVHPFCARGPYRPGDTGSIQRVLCEPQQIVLREGARLFERGATAHAVYVVQSGLVKETVQGPDGEECIVRLVTPSRMAGISALNGLAYRHSAFVMQAGMACRIPVEHIEQLRQEKPDTCQQMLADWLQAADDSDRIITEFSHGPARARMARALLFLHSVHRAGEAFCPRRTDLADLLAITPISVSRLLSAFRREGMIAGKPSRCLSLNLNALQVAGFPNVHA